MEWFGATTESENDSSGNEEWKEVVTKKTN